MPGIEYKGRDYGCQPGETLLEALLRQGADVAHSCRRGSCRCCQLRLVAGEVETRIEIDPAVRDSGHLLPCVSLPLSDVKLAPADPSRQAQPVELVDRRAPGADIVELDLAPARALDFRPGQHVELIRADGLTRPYSIVSRPEDDWFFRVHVRRDPDGTMSRWLCEEARPGERLHLRGAHGSCHYRASMGGRPLLLLAGGSGAGALAGIARDALAQGHPGPIELWHGVRTRWELYLHDALLDLQRRHPQFRYRPCLSREQIGGIAHGYPGELAFAGGRDCSGHEIFLCGPPAMVGAARASAIGAGAQPVRGHPARTRFPGAADPPLDGAARAFPRRDRQGGAARDVDRGRELPVRTHSVEHLDIDTVCDSCGEEIRAGQPSRYQHLAGQLHCARCAGLA